MTKRDEHLNRLSQLPGHLYIPGRLLRWQAPFYIDQGRKAYYLDAKGEREPHRWFRVVDAGGNVVGRGYGNFGTAYLVMEWCYDEARLRDGYPHATPSLAATRDYMLKVETAKLEATALKAEASRKRQLISSKVNKRQRSKHKQDVADYFRASGTLRPRRWGEGRRPQDWWRRDGEDR